MTTATPDFAGFHAMMEEVARFGATPTGGVHRLAASAEDGQARDWMASWLAERGFDVVIDPVGNLFGILDLAGPDAPLILSGSHLDSQPNGGRFDGTYGVIAACSAALAVRAGLARAGKSPTHNLGVVSWTNEEGARFQPSLLGSSVFVGAVPLDTALAIEDGDGVALGDALTAIGHAGRGQAPRPAAYVELHVECGPELEKAGRTIGVMTGWWGAVKTRVVVMGEQAHTGPTAMVARKDALYGASLLVAAIRRLADDVNAGGTERLYTSVGRLEIEPNSPNVVPGRATLFVELRSPEPEVLVEAEAALLRLIEETARVSGLAIEMSRPAIRPAGRFDDDLIELAETAAKRAGHAPMRLLTVAGHDAIPLAGVGPSVVIVTPSVGGVCHHENEFTAPEDLAAGLVVLSDMLAELVSRPIEARR